MFPYSGGKAISTPEVTVRMFPTRTQNGQSRAALPRPKVLACAPEENSVHVDILWLAHREGNCPRERVGGNRELVAELANALGECLAATVGQLVCE